MHKAPLRLRIDEAEQISGLTVVVISVAVIVAIGFTGDFSGGSCRQALYSPAG